MAPWRVDLTPAAVRQLRRLRTDELLALRGVILALADDQHPREARKLSGTDLWRVRLRIDGAPWRIVYQVRSNEQVVIVTRVARRDEATYRKV
jgi:mRNA interferase RelE/StbE